MKNKGDDRTMLSKLKEMFNKNNKELIYAPISGQVVPVTEVSDPTFGEEMVGKGVAIRPTEGKVYAPVNGNITAVFPTLHAIAMVSEDGTEILMHIGLDTVKLKGEFFKAHVDSGADVKKGDLLLEFDIKAISEAGYDTISPVVVCNVDNYTAIEGQPKAQATQDDVIIALTKNA